MGKYSFDDDAREELDVTIVNARHLAGGFKELALRHIKTSREVVTNHYRQLAAQNRSTQTRLMNSIRTRS
jgi:hypothetical protein